MHILRAMVEHASLPEPWRDVRERFRERGLRWTPQRRAVVRELSRTSGHVTGSDLIERCRAADPATIASTVYRTLDVLEELGLVRHGHGADGREEFHVEPGPLHGHRYCASCGGHWEIGDAEAEAITNALRAADGFEVDISHVTVVGRCGDCVGSDRPTSRA
jgi:Fur family transcriptional regulator, ferric uptake regulator